MSRSKRELDAVARWKPGQKWYHPFMAGVIIRLCRFFMTTLNSLDIERLEQFEAQKHRQGRGLLTFSNHVSLFDDPILPPNFDLPRYEDIRWAATDAVNFFGSALVAWFFTSGKGVPIVRGAGLNQSGFHFLRDRLREGQWVHIFPEGGRTRHPMALMIHPLIIINERHLRSVLREYVAYYNGGRPHRTLRLETPTGPPVRAGLPRAGRIIARPVLGGLHHEYEWLAA